MMPSKRYYPRCLLLSSIIALALFISGSGLPAGAPPLVQALTVGDHDRGAEQTARAEYRGPFSSTLQLQLPGESTATGGLIGNVTDAQNGLPIAGATVNISGSPLTAITDSSGHFTFGQIALPAARYPVTVTVSCAQCAGWMLTNAALVVSDTLIVDVQMGTKPVRIDMPVPQALQNLKDYAIQGAPDTMGVAPILTDTVPPATIRVRVTGSASCDTGAPYTVQVVDFKDYVKHVLPNEWISVWDSASLEAGAMAVKTYAWYWIQLGGKWPDADVYDSTCDQVYNPAVAYASTNAAVDATWDFAMTNGGRLFMASYRAYQSQCPAGSYPGCMGQWDSESLAEEGWSWQDILHYFYSDISISALSGDTVPTDSGNDRSVYLPVVQR